MELSGIRGNTTRLPSGFTSTPTLLPIVDAGGGESGGTHNPNLNSHRPAPPPTRAPITDRQPPRASSPSIAVPGPQVLLNTQCTCSTTSPSNEGTICRGQYLNSFRTAHRWVSINSLQQDGPLRLLRLKLTSVRLLLVTIIPKTYKRRYSPTYPALPRFHVGRQR